MKLKALVLLALLTISFVSAVEYDGMVTVTTDHYNDTIEADPDDNTTMKETRIVTVQEIRQQPIKIDDEIEPYEPYEEPEVIEEVIPNKTPNRTPIGVVVVQEIEEPQPKKKLYDYVDQSTIIGILILIIAFCIAVILVNKGKKKSRLTPEEVAKSLLEAGHDEDYVEKVYEKIKREQK